MQKLIFAFIGLYFTQAFAGFTDDIQNFDGDYSTAPALLSSTGMYTDISAKILSPELVYYTVNMAYWVDGSKKKRYIWLPQGTTIVPNDTVGWEYPEGAVIVKNFYIDTLVGNPESEILIETRLLIKRATRWRALNYQWRLDQSDANLVSYNKGNEVIYRRYVNGKLSYWRWRFPGSTAECVTCHKYELGAVGIAGPNLNRISPASPQTNQLAELAERGVLSKNILAENPNLHKWAEMTDTNASVELKARSWFAMNCGYCHNENYKPAGTSHDFSYWRDESEFNYLNIASNRYSEFPRLIFPGKPDSSFVIKRMAERRTFTSPNVDQMPPLISYLPDTQAIKLVSQWVCELGGKDSCNQLEVSAPAAVEEEEFVLDSAKWAAKEIHTSIAYKPEVNAGNGKLKAQLSSSRLQVFGSAAQLKLYDLKGENIVLKPLGNGLYGFEKNINPGIYWLKFSGGSQLVRSF